MSAGRLSAIACVAVCLSIGIMKMLFPTVYDLIGYFLFSVGWDVTVGRLFDILRHSLYAMLPFS